MPRFLFIAPQDGDLPPKEIGWPDSFEIQKVDVEHAGKLLREQEFDGVFFPSDVAERRGLGLFESEAVLDQLPDGVALLGPDGVILRANERLLSWFGESAVGISLYEAMNNPRILSPDYCAINACISKRELTSSLLQMGDRYFRLNAVPLEYPYPDGETRIALTLRDTTRQTLQR